MADVQLAFSFTDDDLTPWPRQDRFPINWNKQLLKRKVIAVLQPDLDRSRAYLIVTGYLSLANIIDTFGHDQFDETKKVRILLGFEPEVRGRKKWNRSLLDQQLKDYWLEQGISPFKCGVVVRTIELIERGVLEFKILDRMHGKLYVGDSHAIMGSSNFSKNGLNFQIEANVRFARESDQQEERERYESVRQIAENYYAEGREFSDEIKELLGRMLKIVDWREALARAIAEVLEGKWLKDYATIYGRLDQLKLWPCQLQGVARGLQILRAQGNLLVADPTGSGKTKMISTLQLALLHWLWAMGQGERAKTSVICPPMVSDNWEREQVDIELESKSPISVGVLQQKAGKRKGLAQRRIGKSRILVLDEAHNYLNPGSNRSQALTAHEADHVILATATPINRRAEDLLRLVELLDPDNLSDKELEEYQALKQKRPLIADDDTVQRLRSYIWKFTLRRTKKDLNALIDREPDAYLNAVGVRCRYPKHKAVTYPTGETDGDIAAAHRINELAHGLKGMIYLRKILVPQDRPVDTHDQRAAYVKGRLGAATALACFRLHATLRSSRAALVEHILGTKAAAQHFNLKDAGNVTGDMVSTLNGMMATLPHVAPLFTEFLPPWLAEPEAFRQACAEEIAVYQHIADEGKRMSDARERTKARQIAQAVRDHGLVVAFDHTVITLHQLALFLAEVKDAPTFFIATGNRERDQHKVLEHFKVGSTSKGMVALCSDSMAEGVNLQQASALVLLDMPSVLRLAEQRIGRVDRLDSPHEEVTVYWPGDHDAFALRSDRNLYNTSRLTDRLLGGNLDLPVEFTHRYDHLQVIKPEDVAATVEQHSDAEWEGVNDAFSEVLALKSGPDALIEPSTYEDLKEANATVRCKVSFTQSASRWAFFALRGSGQQAPRWVFIDSAGSITTEYAEVCHLLRSHLVAVESSPHSAQDLEHFTELFRKNERKTLPHKKRRALDIAEQMLHKQHKYEQERQGQDQYIVKQVLDLFKPAMDDGVVDLERFAGTWLDLLMPRLQDRRAKAKRKREFISISNLSTHRKEAYFSRAELEGVLEKVELTASMDQQLAACIVGVSSRQGS